MAFDVSLDVLSSVIAHDESLFLLRKLGRGQLVRSHPGNVSFRQDFIQARSGKYNAANSRDEKNEIVSDILRDIAATSRRFLKQHPSGYWTELGREVAKEKVMMAFREYRKSQKLEASRGGAASVTVVAGLPPLPPVHPAPPPPPSAAFTHRLPPVSLPSLPLPQQHPYPYHQYPFPCPSPYHPPFVPHLSQMARSNIGVLPTTGQTIARRPSSRGINHSPPTTTHGGGNDEEQEPDQKRYKTGYS